jgi:4-amino-4-deoxy-L-arabinose transferase-like glycosyltransferase
MPDDVPAAKETPPDDEHRPPELVPPGNALRPKSLIVAVGALFVPFFLMATTGHHALSVPLGALSFLLSACALLDFLGTFDDERGHRAPVELRSVLPRLGELAGAILVLVAALRLVVSGRLPWSLATGALLITAGVVWVMVAVWRVLARLGISTDSPPLHRRWGFWLLVLAVALYVPLLGGYSLSDPWETHYGEVAREMLSRDDWVSTWWAQENWFWSKPVLDFWLQALSFSLFGVGFLPDQMLAGASHGLVPRPEWAARLPIVVLTLVALYLLYRAVAQRFGARAGFLGGLVLVTMPYWYVIARQSMTDMPYVAPLTAAVALAMMGLTADPEARAEVHPLKIGRRVFALSAFHLLFVVVLASALPQSLYLLSRHVTIALEGESRGVRFHLDEILYGSPGNCGLPGNEACRMVEPADPVMQPALIALFSLAVTGLLLWANRGERRTQRLYFLGAWYAVALAALAKGAPGLVLPLAIAFVGLLSARRYRELARAELVGFLLIFSVVCLPWYTAMFGRHGPPFTDRLLFHDMYKRAFVHVHDTNTGDDVSFRYYVWQLGYGLFPWLGAAVAGLLSFQREGNESTGRKSEGLALLALWFAISFALFSLSLTKFHHYVLPAVPAVAMLTGITLDRSLPSDVPNGKPLVAYLAAAGAASLMLPYGVLRLVPGSLFGRVPVPAATPISGGISLVVGAVAFALCVRLWPASSTPPDEKGRYESAIASAFALGGAILVLLVGRDLFSPDDPDGPARLTELASYNYKRIWPATLDFTGVMFALSVVAALATLAVLFRNLVHHAVVLLAGVAFWAAAWATNVYVPLVAPHWGQRETVIEYYKRRQSPDELLVAYQMNWKGENFYTGNRIPAFVASGAKFKSFIEEQREEGAKVMFFTTEHSREASLKSDLGKVRRFERLTDKALNNKFFLARVEL